MLGLDVISCRVCERRSCETMFSLGREANVLASGNWVGVEVDMVEGNLVGLSQVGKYVRRLCHGVLEGSRRLDNCFR